jgi:hypothetical protein
MTTIASLPNRLPCLSKDKSFSEGTADTSPRFAFFPRFHTLRDVKCVSNNTLALRHIQHAGRRKKLPSSEIEEVRCCFLQRQEPCMKELRIQALGLLCLLRPLWDSKCVSNNTLILRHIQYTGRRKILRRTRDPFNKHKNFSKGLRTRRSPPLNTKHQTPNTNHRRKPTDNVNITPPRSPPLPLPPRSNSPRPAGRNPSRPAPETTNNERNDPFQLLCSQPDRPQCHGEGTPCMQEPLRFHPQWPLPPRYSGTSPCGRHQQTHRQTPTTTRSPRRGYKIVSDV